MKKILFGILFIAICFKAYAVPLQGDLDLQGDVTIANGCWELISETDVTVAATSIAVENLTSDTDDTYKAVCRFVSNADNNVYSIRFNADATGSHHGVQILYAEDTSITAARTPSSSVEINREASNLSISSCNVIIGTAEGLAKTAIATYADDIYNTTVGYVGMVGGTWIGTDEVIRLTFRSNQTNGIGVGSHIELWRKRS